MSPASTHVELDAAVEGFRARAEKARLPGVALRVRRGQKVVTLLHGAADAEGVQRLTSDTTCRMASISKLLTSVAVGTLVDDGMLDLDEPVGPRLSGLRLRGPAGAREITARDLLSHTAGIGEAPTLAAALVSARRRGGTPATADVLLAHGVRAEVAPGRRWAYANYGHAVLGALLADLAAAPFADVVRERVLEPLGMDRTDADDARLRDRGAARGLRRTPDGPVPEPDVGTPLTAAGGFFSTLDDLGRLADAVLRGFPGVLTRSTWHELRTPHFQPDPFLGGWSLAGPWRRLGDTDVVGHAGSLPGWKTVMHVAPEARASVVAWTNTQAKALDRMALDALREVVGVADVATRELDAAEVDAEADRAAGRFVTPPGLLTSYRPNTAFGGQARIVRQGEGLVLRTPVGAFADGASLRRSVDGPGDGWIVGLEGTDFTMPVRLVDVGGSGTVQTVLGPPGFRFDRGRPRLAPLVLRGIQRVVS